MKTYSNATNHPTIQSLSLIDRQGDRRLTSRRVLGQGWLHAIMHWFTHEAEAIKIWVTYGDQQQALWHATDRHTGKSIHHVSEDEMRRWVEQRGSGAKGF